MTFSGSDKCNKDIKILPIFFKCLYFPPYSTQILCTIMFIVLPIYSPHLRFSPVFILAWQNPNLIKPKPLPSSHLLLGSWICLEKNNNPNWSHFDFMVTIPTGSSLQLPGNHITFPNPPIPILLPNSCVLSPETCNSPLPHSLMVNDFAPNFTEKLNGLLKLPPHLPKLT